MKNSISLLKSYIYIVLWILYFGFFFAFPKHEVFTNIHETLIYWDVLLSYFNAVFWFITLLWLSNILIKTLELFFKKFTGKTETELDDVLSDFVVRFLNLVKYIASAYIFFHLAQTPDYINVIVDQATSVLVIFIFLSLLTSFINIVFEKELLFKSKLKAVSKTLLPFINKVIIIFVWIIWSITIIGNLGYDVTALVAGAWIGWLAVALAAQKSLTNVFGAITILLNKPFKIWDYINVNGHIGTVKDIWLSYLTITDKMWHQVMIPNEAIISTSIENYSVRSNRRTDFTIWVVYGTSQDKMQEWVKIIENILEKYITDKTISSWRVNFDMFGDFSLNINVTYFSLINKSFVEYIKQKEEINLTIKAKFEKSWLDMAFPTQELIIKKEG